MAAKSGAAAACRIVAAVHGRARRDAKVEVQAVTFQQHRARAFARGAEDFAAVDAIGHWQQPLTSAVAAAIVRQAERADAQAQFPQRLAGVAERRCRTQDQRDVQAKGAGGRSQPVATARTSLGVRGVRGLRRDDCASSGHRLWPHCTFKPIVHVDSPRPIRRPKAQVTHCGHQFGVAQQQLHGAQALHTPAQSGFGSHAL